MDIQSIRDELKRILNERLKVADDWRTIPDGFNVRDSGLDLDSVESLELLVGIEQSFGIRLDLAQIDRRALSSLPYLVEVVMKRLGGASPGCGEAPV